MSDIRETVGIEHILERYKILHNNFYNLNNLYIDIMSDLIPLMDSVSGDSDSPNAAYCLVNKCATVLNAVSDEIIASMPDDKRINIAKYLDKQAERYMTANV